MEELSTYISFKLTKKDKQLIQEVANKNKLSTGTFCRFILLNKIKEENNQHAGFFS